MTVGKKSKFFFTCARSTGVYCRVMKHVPNLGLREARLLGLKGYPGDVSDTYFKGTGILGKAAGVVSLGVEGLDQGIRRLSGREFEAPQGIMGRTRRDIGALFGHLGKGEFVKAATAGWSVVSGDVLMDGIDVVGGFRK
jgi:hypothetical protein